MKKILVIMVSVAILGLLFAGCSQIANITSPGTTSSGGGALDEKGVGLADLDKIMYATDYETDSESIPVNITNYSEYHYLRLDPANVLGGFDAVQSAGGIANRYFFGLAARDWTTYTFDDIFWNIDGEPDIEFAEVTWGTGWHTEAAKVYLTEAYILDGGNIVAYEGSDDGIGYYAGIVWNKVGINGLSDVERETITESYFIGTRDFGGNVFAEDGNFGISKFSLPDEVIFATGITLVDITDEVYNLAGTSSTYTGGSGGIFTVNWLPIEAPNDGDVTIEAGGVGNTDGFDLDAIRVFGYEETASLTIEKVVTQDDPADPDKAFNFTIEGPESFFFQFSLKDGEHLSFPSIPIGVYTITETDSGANWSVEVTGGDNNNPCEIELLFNDDETITFTNNYMGMPEIEVVKECPPEFAYVGDELIYNYTVCNIGDGALLDVTLNDDPLDLIALTGLTDEDADGYMDDLAEGACATGTASYIVQEGDTVIVNSATATSTSEIDDSTVTDVSDECIVEVCYEETAFGGDTAFEGRGAWWFYFSGTGTQTIWAGQHYDAGTVTVTGCIDDEVTITIDLADGWYLADDDEAVKIQGYDCEDIPNRRPVAGLFTTYKGDELAVTVDCYGCYVIHLDLQHCGEFED